MCAHVHAMGSVFVISGIMYVCMHVCDMCGGMCMWGVCDDVGDGGGV